MLRGKRTSASKRRQVLADLRSTQRRNGRPNYKRVADKHGLHERTVRRIQSDHEFDVPQRPLGRPPAPGNTAVEVAKKLLRLPEFKRKWPVRRLAKEINVNKSTLHELLPVAQFYVENPNARTFKVR